MNLRDFCKKADRAINYAGGALALAALGWFVYASSERDQGVTLAQAQKTGAAAYDNVDMTPVGVARPRKPAKAPSPIDVFLARNPH